MNMLNLNNSTNEEIINPWRRDAKFPAPWAPKNGDLKAIEKPARLMSHSSLVPNPRIFGLVAINVHVWDDALLA